MEGARPAVIEGERLGEGLSDDVACLVGIEEFGVERDDLNCEVQRGRRHRYTRTILA